MTNPAHKALVDRIERKIAWATKTTPGWRDDLARAVIAECLRTLECSPPSIMVHDPLGPVASTHRFLRASALNPEEQGMAEDFDPSKGKMVWVETFGYALDAAEASAEIARALTSALARVKELEDGLRPFGKWASRPNFENWAKGKPDSFIIFGAMEGNHKAVTISDLRRARDLLAKKGEG